MYSAILKLNNTFQNINGMSIYEIDITTKKLVDTGNVFSWESSTTYQLQNITPNNVSVIEIVENDNNNHTQINLTRNNVFKGSLINPPNVSCNDNEGILSITIIQ